MKVNTAMPMLAIDRSSTVGTAARAAEAAPPRHTAAALVGALTESDRGFLLNALGMTVTTQGPSMTFHGTENLRAEEGMAASQLAMQLMADRLRGAVDGDVSPAYLHALLIRSGNDSGQTAFHDVIGKALDYITKGSQVARVDTHA